MASQEEKNKLYEARRDLLNTLDTTQWIDLSIILGVPYPLALRDKEKLIYSLKKS